MFAFLALLVTVLATSAPQERPGPNIILVTIDGTRWQEIYNGSDRWRDQGHHLTPRQIVPNLYTYFVDQGIAVGKLTPMVASGPMHISLPGYLEITRGHPSFDCQSNTCSPSIDQSVFWFFRRPVIVGSWYNIIKTVPSEANAYVNVGDPYRWDDETISQTNWVLDNQDSDFLWVSLGDTDELAHRNDYPGYIKALQKSDAFIGDLVKRYPNATVIVTCDHGRNADFRDHGIDKASERVWLMMRGPNVPAKGTVPANKVSLSNIMPTITDIEFGSHSPDSILSKIR